MIYIGISSCISVLNVVSPLVVVILVAVVVAVVVVLVVEVVLVIVLTKGRGSQRLTESSRLDLSVATRFDNRMQVDANC